MTIIQQINTLERRIYKADRDVDAMLWKQAERVVALNQTKTQAQIAAKWINPRDGKRYSQAHVSRTIAVYEIYASVYPRPEFRKVFNDFAHRDRPNPEPTPFHWLNAANDLRRACLAEAKRWPPEAHRLLPDLLRKLADDFTRRGVDVNRRDRIHSASSDHDQTDGPDLAIPA